MLSFMLVTTAESQERSLEEDRAQINQDENALIGKFVEEAARLERGAVKAFKAEAARDKEIITARPKSSVITDHATPSIESIEADLEAREKLALEIENKDKK